MDSLSRYRLKLKKSIFYQRNEQRSTQTIYRNVKSGDNTILLIMLQI